MPFPYYDNLSAAKKRIYRKSDAIESIPVKDPGRIHSVVIELRKSLADNKRSKVAEYSSEICHQVCEGLGTETLIVKISSKRPSSSTEELHGLYEWTEGETPAVTIWMKTAVKRQVVAFKSFIRTMLHELCHHLDYTYFDIEESFHTEGFFKRESSLYKQIIPVELQKTEPQKKKSSRKKNLIQKSKKSEQMELF